LATFLFTRLQRGPVEFTRVALRATQVTLAGSGG